MIVHSRKYTGDACSDYSDNGNSQNPACAEAEQPAQAINTRVRVQHTLSRKSIYLRVFRVYTHNTNTLRTSWCVRGWMPVMPSLVCYLSVSLRLRRSLGAEI